MKRRIFYSDNGALNDFTPELARYPIGAQTMTFVAAEDYIFIGSELPFNHFYIKLGTTVNLNAANMAVSYWDGSQFRSVVNLIDETSGLSQAGYVTWLTDRDHGWIREDTNHGGNSVTGLTSIEVYDLYWLRIGFDADLTADLDLNWIGQKFSDDDDLGGEHAELVRSGFISSYETGKTDWEEQHVIAAELIADDLIEQNVIVAKEQILYRENLRRASVKKTAQVIYTGMGRDYYDDRDQAKKEYENRINKAVPETDKNRNARLDLNERYETGRLYR